MNAVGSSEDVLPGHQHAHAACRGVDRGREGAVHQEVVPADGKPPVCTINLPLASHTPTPLSPPCATRPGAHFHHGEGAGAIGIHWLVREVLLEVLRD